MQILRFDTNCQNKFIKSHLKNWYITICLLKNLFVKQFLQLIFSSLLYSIFFSYHNHVISHPLPCLILHYFSFSMIQYMHLWNIWCIHAHISPSSAQVDQYPYVKREKYCIKSPGTVHLQKLGPPRPPNQVQDRIETTVSTSNLAIPKMPWQYCT